MTPQITNLRILIAKNEVTKGTYIAMLNADFDVRVRGIEITPTVEPDDENSKHATGDHGEDNSIMGAQSVTITCFTRMAWGGAVDTIPLWDKFNRACGVKSVVIGGVGVTFEPLKEYDGESMSIQVIDIQRGASPSAIAYQFSGCMGNVIYTAEGVGMPLLAQYTMTGKIHDVVDVTGAGILALTGQSTVVGEKLLNAPVTLGGVAGQQISSFALNAGNDVQPEIDQADPTGYRQFNIVARRPRLSVNPLQQLVATNPIYDKVKDGTRGACSIATQAASPHFTFHVPDAQNLSAALAAREGLGGWASNYKCLRNGTTESDISDECGWQILQGDYV